MKRILIGKKTLPAFALVLGILFGSLLFTSAFAAERQASIFKMNKNGLTYGTMMDVGPESPESPDLVAAVGIGGIEGYVRKAELDADKPKTPEEAIAYMERLNKRIEQMSRTGEEYVITIPLYDINGNPIGEYGISPPFDLTIK